jgi:hypothetical protein
MQTTALQPRFNPLLTPRAARLGEQTHVMRRSTAKRDLLDLISAEDCASAIAPLPGVEESIHAVVNRSFHGWSVVDAVLSLAGGATIDEMSVSTLGFNSQNSRNMLDKLDAGIIGKVDFLCSCYFKAASGAEYGALSTGLKERGHRIAARRSHAKIIAMLLSDGRSFVVETSANLRSCKNIEQVTLTHSEPLRAFHSKWIASLVAQGDEVAAKNASTNPEPESEIDDE